MYVCYNWGRYNFIIVVYAAHGCDVHYFHAAEMSLFYVFNTVEMQQLSYTCVKNEINKFQNV